jgi:hypothetical protein
MATKTSSNKGAVILARESDIPSVTKLGQLGRKIPMKGGGFVYEFCVGVYRPSFSRRKKVALWKKIGNLSATLSGELEKSYKRNQMALFGLARISDGTPRAVFWNTHLRSTNNSPLTGEELRAAVRMHQLGLYKDDAVVGYAFASLL